MTAVSTTGFAPGARSAARELGVELREVLALDPVEFQKIFMCQGVVLQTSFSELHGFELRGTMPSEVHTALGVTQEDSLDSVVLRAPKTGRRFRACDAFCEAVTSKGGLFDGLEIGGKGRLVEFTVNYQEDDHFVIDTAAGEAHIATIVFRGALFLRRKEHLALDVSRYSSAGNRNTDTIADRARYEVPMIGKGTLMVTVDHLPTADGMYLHTQFVPNQSVQESGAAKAKPRGGAGRVRRAAKKGLAGEQGV